MKLGIRSLKPRSNRFLEFSSPSMCRIALITFPILRPLYNTIAAELRNIYYKQREF